MERLKKAVIFLIGRNEKYRLFTLLGGYLFGLIISLVVYFGTEGEEYPPIGIIIAASAMLLLTLFLTVGCYTSDLPELIRLGVSRKLAIAAATVETLVTSLLWFAVLLLLEWVEYLTLGQLVSTAKPLLTGYWWAGLAVIFVAWMMGILAAWCIRRFGHNGLMAIYCIYVAIFVLVPQLFGAAFTRFQLVRTVVEFIMSSIPMLCLTGLLISLVSGALLLRAHYRQDI